MKFLFVTLSLAITVHVQAQAVDTFNPNEALVTTPSSGPQFRAPTAVLFDQGPVFTQTGTPNNLSILNTAMTPPYCTLGASAVGAFRLADDFTVPAGQSWIIDKVTVFGYQTNATAPSINAGTLRILSTDPTLSATPTAVFGDTTTNRVTAGSVTLSGTVRVTSTTLTATNRLLQAIPLTISPAVTLTAGTYWIDFNAAGTVASGPFFPPLSPVITAPAVSGNASQQPAAGAAHVALVQNLPNPDCQTPTPGPAQGIPFIVEGTLGVISAITPVTPAGAIAVTGATGQSSVAVPLNFRNAVGATGSGTVSCALTNPVSATLAPATAVSIAPGATGGFTFTGTGTPGSAFSGTVTCTIQGVAAPVVYTVNGTISAVTAINTLSNFGFLALGLALLGFGVFASRRFS